MGLFSRKTDNVEVGDTVEFKDDRGRTVEGKVTRKDPAGRKGDYGIDAETDGLYCRSKSEIKKR